MESMESLQYPIGRFKRPGAITDVQVKDWIAMLEDLPERLERLVKNLNAEQLDTAYRPGGWTVRQVIHHIADSHHHSYTRFKWALTEDKPVIKAYREKNWSDLFDAKTAPIQLSLNYLKVLHAKLVYLLKGLSKSDMKLFYIHPEDNSMVALEENIAKYAWHGSHHYAHIEGLLKRQGWL
ncbi:YfiT family bacillithiol transferase [Costertonia aggregata]|uniref:Putative metal-dependent hydrolase n=1 Tax=Costertonia aggregata TaxID=343403 RepID=A0A7H9AST7_9FLAO|nr:putative metal-dependent hydrolase [Costertonia aggregata]QLG46265.1 putative metal-dependent hydrolase [Costertonia aggregata]